MMVKIANYDAKFVKNSMGFHILSCVAKHSNSLDYFFPFCTAFFPSQLHHNLLRTVSNTQLKY